MHYPGLVQLLKSANGLRWEAWDQDFHMSPTAYRFQLSLARLLVKMTYYKS